jgi:hypothetical protein
MGDGRVTWPLLARKSTNEYFGPGKLPYAIVQALPAQATLSSIQMNQQTTCSN